MHELSIAQALIEQAEREADRFGHAGRIRSVDVSVGCLAGVSCDSLRFAFQLLAEDSGLAGAELRIRQPKATCCCRECNARVEIGEIIVCCPECGSGKISVEGGRDLLLESIEIED